MLTDEPLSPAKTQSRGVVLGLVILVVGLLGVYIVYSMRPPDSLGDAFTMLVNGRQNVLEPPLYKKLMLLTIVTAMAGGIIAMKCYEPRTR